MATLTPTGHGAPSIDFKTVDLNALGMASSIWSPVGVGRPKMTSVGGYLDVMLENETAAVAIIRTIDAMVSLPRQILDETGKEVTPRDPDTDPAFKLFDNPNPFHSHAAQLERLVIHILLTGSAYEVDLRPSMSKVAGGYPAELWVMNPNMVRPVPDAKKFLSGYEISGADGARETLPIERVFRYQFAHPKDLYKGLGRPGSAERLFDVDIEMAEFVYRYLLNNATPGGLLTTEALLSKETREDIRRSWKETHKGSKNAGDLAIVWGGLKYQQVQQGLADIGYAENREANRRSIDGLFGVPPLLTGHVTGDVARSNAETQEYIFMKWTIKPLAKRFNEVRTKLLRRIRPGWTYQLQVEIAQDLATIGPALKGLVDGAIMTRDDARKALGLKPLGGPAAVLTVAGMVTTLEDAVKPPEPVPSALAGPVQDPRAPAPGTVVDPRRPAGNQPGGGAPASGNEPPPPAAVPDPRKSAPAILRGRRRMSRTAQIALWRFSVRYREPRIRGLRIEMREFYLRMGRELAAEIAGGKGVAGAIADAIKAKEASPNLTSYQQQLQRALMAFYISDLQDVVEAVDNVIGIQSRGQDFAPGFPVFDASVRRLAEHVKYINGTDEGILAHVLSQGMDRGYSPLQIAAGVAADGFPGITGACESMSSWRANLIARTECAGTYYEGALNSYAQMGAETIDIVGCEDNSIVAGEQYGCNSRGIPIMVAPSVKFHPNHTGTAVPGDIGGKSARLLLARESAVLTLSSSAVDNDDQGPSRALLALASFSQR